MENLSEKLKVHFVDLTLSACNINSELKDPEIRGGIYKKLRLSDESMKSIERDFEKKYSNMYEDRRLGGGLDTTNYVPYSDVNNSKIKPLNFPRDKGEGK